MPYNYKYSNMADLTVVFDDNSQLEIDLDKCVTKLVRLKELFRCGADSSLVKSLPNLDERVNIYKFFASCPELFAGTVTIGRKWIGKLNDVDQYKIIKQRIKSYMGYNDDAKYYFVFEHQKNGQLHAHTVYYNMYQNRHIEAFGDMGSRNGHNASFKPINKFDNYWNYIHKDQDKMYSFPVVHNIKKKDYKKIKDNLDAEVKLTLFDE